MRTLLGRLTAARPYLLAVALTAAAVAASSWVAARGARPPLLLFVIPILAAVAAGGRGAGVLATAVAALAAAWPAREGSVRLGLPTDRLEWAALWAIGLGLTACVEVARRRWRSADALRWRSRNVFARQLRASAAEAKATRFQRFTRDAPIGIVLSSEDGTVQFANDEFLRIVGRSREELDAEWRRREAGAIGALWGDDGGSRSEREILRPDGRRVPVLVGVSRQEDGFAAFVLDLTAERAAEQARRESEERFRTLADQIAQLAWIADARGRIFWHNRRWVDYAGAVPPEMDGAEWRSAIHPAHRERVGEKLRRSLATGEVWEDTFPLRAADGRYHWFLSRAVPIADERGALARWFGTSTDVTELREAEERIQEADRRKSEFLGVLSHELRNPLAPIRNSLYILERADPASDQALRARVVIGRQVGHLTRLVDDLLDVTRIARGKVELRRAPLNLNELVRRSGDDYRDVLRQHGLSLTVRVPEEALWVSGDATRLAQVVGNLVQNAEKFSTEGGEVELALEAASGRAEIRVRDTGVGIPPELLGAVFEPFVQAERTLARTQGGLGLGLALVKGLVELHGGSVEALSGGAGQGAELVVRLPTIPAPRAAARREDGSAGQRSPRRVRVLVVEDSHDVAESLAQLVTLLGHDVEVAHDGVAALARAHANPPDIVLCDIGLPGMSGFDVARAFRADPVLRHAGLVAVTGYALPEDRRDAAEAGFERHIAKPADPAEIERILAS